jgi:hypothetical protein
MAYNYSVGVKASGKQSVQEAKVPVPSTRYMQNDIRNICIYVEQADNNRCSHCMYMALTLTYAYSAVPEVGDKRSNTHEHTKGNIRACKHSAGEKASGKQPEEEAKEPGPMSRYMQNDVHNMCIFVEQVDKNMCSHCH